MAGVDDGLLGMVATKAGDVIMVREYAGQWDLLRYDVTADPIVELNRNTSVENLENGILGVVALGNDGFVIARQGAGDTIDLFAYDGTTLAETGNNLTDPNRKTLGNGYPITAVSGKGSVMKKASDTFISSTFWTDRIGYVAAIETLKKMKKIRIKINHKDERGLIVDLLEKKNINAIT